MVLWLALQAGEIPGNLGNLWDGRYPGGKMHGADLAGLLAKSSQNSGRETRQVFGWM